MIARYIFALIIFSVININLAQKPVDYWDETEPFGNPTAPSPDLRLPTYIVPSFYRLKLKTDLDNSKFSGDVFITLRANKGIRDIILHAKNLSINSNAKLTEQIYETVETLITTKVKREIRDDNITESQNITLPLRSPLSQTDATITEVTNIGNIMDNITETTTTTNPPPIKETIDTEITHSAVRSIKILSIIAGTGDRIIIMLESALKTNVDYILQLSFEGFISNSLTGFYKSTYTDSQGNIRSLGVTQFEPTSARSAFPCFDEPAFKAKFEISIAHPQNITALSNMKIVAEEPITELPGWQWTHFDRSVSMSTYLVAYVLSDFKALETNYTSRNNITIPIKVWTRPEFISKAKYALTITPKLLTYYEDVFGVPYELDKMDLIAIPDFSSGAMENWGLVTFRETTLLFDEAESVPRDRQNVAIDVAHELAHQWFGNLVTMRWWTDLWLNEGFATYIEYVGVDRIEPEWNMFESFSRDKMDLLRSDALKNTSPVSRKVVDASEISQKFDEISYTKGANLIRMLNHTISEEMFHKGLVIYLNDWKFANAEETDLWKSMSKATQSDPSLKDLSVVDFMNSWTKQAGYPVVNVNRNYDTGAVEIEQRLFTSSDNPYQKMRDQLWHIPISYAVVGSPANQWSTKPKTWLKGRLAVVNVPINASQALYVNVGAIGYYRVNYDQRNWRLLSEALKAGLVKSPITKSQLIDDAFNLAKVSHLNYSYALGLTTCVINGEISKMVWDQLLNNMAFLRHNLRATSGYLYFQDYMKIILAKQLEAVNYGLDKPKDDNEAFLIENLVMWECYVESPRCLQWAREQFDNWTKQNDYNNNPIPSYLRSLVYNMALKHGGRAEFEFLWNVFMNSTDPNVKSLIIQNLPSVRDEAIITMLLEKSLDEIPKHYAVAVWAVEPPVGTRLAQRFLMDHFDRVYDKFNEMDVFMFPAVVSGAFGFITTEEELTTLKSFALAHKQQLLPMSQVLQKLVDTARFRIDWVRTHAPAIDHWLRQFVAGADKKAEVPTTMAPPTTNFTRDTTNSILDTTNSTRNTTNSTSDTMNSTSDITHSTSDTANSTSDITHSTSDTTNSTSDTTNSTSDTTKSTSDTTNSTSDTTNSTSDTTNSTSNTTNSTRDVTTLAPILDLSGSR